MVCRSVFIIWSDSKASISVETNNHQHIVPVINFSPAFSSSRLFLRKSDSNNSMAGKESVYHPAQGAVSALTLQPRRVRVFF